jgi:hypothetical protein
VGEVQESLGSWKKRKTHPRLTYATGRNLSLDGEAGRVEGKWWGGFCIWSLGLAEGRVLGMEVFLCWFVFGHCRLFGTFGGVEKVGGLVF